MSSVFSVGRSSSHTHTHPFTAEACVLKYISLPWVKRRVCSSARCFFGEPAPECIKEQVRRKKNIGMINDSAARHPSIDSLTPINEGQRCLGFIKVATYEILKWARQQHNVELHMTSHQKRKRRREKRKGGRCEEQKKRNSADSRRGSGNTHISVSETEAAELCRVDIILAEDSLKTGRRTRVWSIYWCQDQVVHYVSFNLLRFSIRAKLKCFTSATKRATSLSTEYNLLLLLLLFILKMSTVDSSEICLETQTWTVV